MPQPRRREGDEREGGVRQSERRSCGSTDCGELQPDDKRNREQTDTCIRLSRSSRPREGTYLCRRRRCSKPPKEPQSSSHTTGPSLSPPRIARRAVWVTVAVPRRTCCPSQGQLLVPAAGPGAVDIRRGTCAKRGLPPRSETAAPGARACCPRFSVPFSGQPKSDSARKYLAKNAHTTTRLSFLVSTNLSSAPAESDNDDSRTRPSRCSRAVRVMPLP